MKRKIKCYMAYTTFLYRLLGVVLIPCAFWILYGILLWEKYNGRAQYDVGELYGLHFALSAYVVFYELFTDFWVLGGCFSDAGKGLRYFRTSQSGWEVMRNVVSVDLMRRFLYCMIFSGISFLMTGWRLSIVMGLVVYCAIVGILHGSRHFDGLQRSAGIAVLSQIGVTLANTINVVLLKLAGDGGEIMLVFLTAVYCAVALALSRLMVRRVTARIRNGE